jgi:hypothetical protein
LPKGYSAIQIPPAATRRWPVTLASGQVLGTPTLFIDGVVHRGSYDAATLLRALAR